MPKINVGLDDVKEFVDPGWYPVVVVGGEVKTSKNNNEYVSWQLEIDQPDGEFDRVKLIVRNMLEGRGLVLLKKFLEACEFGWDPDGFDTEDVLGSQLEVLVETATREIEGEERVMNEVKAYRPAL